MKTINTIKKVVLLVITISTLIGCTLSDLDIPKISEDNVIRDEKSAQYLLDGVYTKFRKRSTVDYMINYVLRIEMYSPYSISRLSSQDFQDFINNNLKPGSKGMGYFEYFYGSMYDMIDNCNELITKLEADKGNSFKISEKRKNELLGEAKGLRAFCHFMLLRTFGEFYNINSPVGIIIADRVLTAKDLLPRNSVKEVYSIIEKDLLFSSKNAPAKRDKKRIYFTQDVAKAMLSKIYLYTGKYKKSIEYAKKIINNPSYKLENDYASIFIKRWNSSEVLFSLYSDGVKESSIATSGLGHPYYIAFSSVYQSIPDVVNQQRTAYADKRSLFITNTKGLGLINGLSNKYPFSARSPLGNGNTFYFMRTAEMYLICAEAQARTGNNAEALENLNKVRKRSNAIQRKFTSNKRLLDDIREEKVLELIYESGEPWFDAVRHDRLGNMVIGKVKPTLAKNPKNPTETDSYKLIFPIPYNIIKGNKNLTQTPNY